MALIDTIEKYSAQAKWPKTEKFLASGGIRYGNKFPCVWKKADFRKMPTSSKSVGVASKKRGGRD